MPARKRRTGQSLRNSQKELSAETHNITLSTKPSEENISYINNVVNNIAENIKSQFEDDFSQFVLVIINAHSHNEHLQKLIQVSKEQGELLSNKEIKDIVSTSIKAVVKGLLLANSLSITDIALKYLGEKALERLDKIFDMVQNETNRLLCTDKYINSIIMSLSINQDSDQDILNMVNKMLGNTVFDNEDEDNDDGEDIDDDIPGFDSGFDLPF